MTDMIEIPVERAQWFGNLLTAARGWRSALIPGTSTAAWNEVVGLVTAISAFDPEPCDHPRSWRVFYPNSAGGGEVCGYCGTSVKGSTAPSGTSDPPTSSQSES